MKSVGTTLLGFQFHRDCGDNSDIVLMSWPFRLRMVLLTPCCNSDKLLSTNRSVGDDHDSRRHP
jgi:hypothetical protein